MTNKIICMIKIATHSGGFHTDDVFAIATLQLLYGGENVEVVRTRDESVLAIADIVVDVGGVYDVATKRFDHHQNGGPVRDNGIPYAAFGLVWREYGEKVAGGKEVADEIEHMLVLAVDAGDSGVNLYELKNVEIPVFELYQITRSFLPEWGSSKHKDECFVEVLDFARNLLTRIIRQKQAEVEMKKLIAKTYQEAIDKRVLVFDVPVNPIVCIQYEEVLMVAFRRDTSVDNSWTVEAVRKKIGSFESRINFPSSWLGLRDSELAKVSGISDAIFCHKTGYKFVAGSKEGVMEAVAKVVG